MTTEMKPHPKSELDDGTKDPIVHIQDQERTTPEQMYSICGEKLKGIDCSLSEINCVVCIDLYDVAAAKRRQGGDNI